MTLFRNVALALAFIGALLLGFNGAKADLSQEVKAAIVYGDAYYSSATLLQVDTDVQDAVGDNLSEPNPYENWQFILAFFLPILIAFLVDQSWSEGTKAAAAFGISAIATIIGMALQGTLDTDPLHISTTILEVVAPTIIFYKGIWKNVGINRAVGTKGVGAR